jgi:hypothetical protein
MGLVNAGGFQFPPPEKTRFLAFSPEKTRFKKSVKYNVKAAINDKRGETGAAPVPPPSQ